MIVDSLSKVSVGQFFKLINIEEILLVTKKDTYFRFEIGNYISRRDYKGKNVLFVVEENTH